MAMAAVLVVIDPDVSRALDVLREGVRLEGPEEFLFDASRLTLPLLAHDDGLANEFFASRFTSGWHTNRADWYLMVSSISDDRADHIAIRAFADSALAALDSLLEYGPAPEGVYGAKLYWQRGEAPARLDRDGLAVTDALRAVELLPIHPFADFGADPLVALAHAYTVVERYEEAIETLEYLMGIPSQIS